MGGVLQLERRGFEAFVTSDNRQPDCHHSNARQGGIWVYHDDWMVHRREMALHPGICPLRHVLSKTCDLLNQYDSGSAIRYCQHGTKRVRGYFGRIRSCSAQLLVCAGTDPRPSLTWQVQSLEVSFRTWISLEASLRRISDELMASQANQANNPPALSSATDELVKSLNALTEQITKASEGYADSTGQQGLLLRLRMANAARQIINTIREPGETPYEFSTNVRVPGPTLRRPC